MTSTGSFDHTSASAPLNALPFDFNLPTSPISNTTFSQLSLLSEHLHTLSEIQSATHALSTEQPPSLQNILNECIVLSGALSTYHGNLQQMVQPLNGEPMVLGAERYVARLKEHSGFLNRLEGRKQAIRRVKEELEKMQVKKGGLRKDLRFSEKRIEALVKELGLMVFADDSSNTPSHARRLTLGGKLVVIDIDFTIATNDTTAIAPISSISLSIAPADDESISSLGPAAAQVLLNNFHTQDADIFVRNMSNLAKWDGCSDPPNEGLNCFAVLKGVEDALEIIYAQELKAATEDQVMTEGWGKPARNKYNLVGLSITYAPGYSVLIGVEPRRPQFMHPPLLTTYIPSEQSFVIDEGMFPQIADQGSQYLVEQPNWQEQNLDGSVNLLNGANCSFVLDLNPPVVMSVDSAKALCDHIGYGGWNDVLTGVIPMSVNEKETTLEELLFGGRPHSASVKVELPGGENMHRYEFVPMRPIAARRVEKIPFSHPRQLFPVLKILRQWSKFNQLLKACFSTDGQMADPLEMNLEDLLNGTAPSALPVTISPISVPPSLLIVFPVGNKLQSMQVSVLENGELQADVEESLKERMKGLIDGAGIGVGIEFLKKELSA